MKFELKDFTRESICAAINQEWGLGVRLDEIIEPPQGKDGHTVFVRDMVVKFLRCDEGDLDLYREDVRLARFRREAQTIQSIEGKDLGVIVPKVLYTGTNTAMFAMTRVDQPQPLLSLAQYDLDSATGAISLDDWVIKKLACFTVALDLAKRDDAPRLANLTRPWAIPHELLDYTAKSSLGDLLKTAATEMCKPCCIPYRFVHGDLKSTNILADKATKTLAIVDFGWAEYKDAHYQVALMPVHYEYDGRACSKLVDAINQSSRDGPWLDGRRVAALASVFLAKEAKTWNHISPEGKGTEWFEDAVVRVREASDSLYKKPSRSRLFFSGLFRRQGNRCRL